MAEALATLHAVIFAKELGFSNVIFEGDALIVVKAVNSKEPCESNYGHLVEDVKRFRSNFKLRSCW
jgi:ribonuclease HI